MARGTYISDRERDQIRAAHIRGVKNYKIAKALGRTKAAIGQQIKRMTQDGTLHDLPFDFVADDLCAQIEQSEKAEGADV